MSIKFSSGHGGAICDGCNYLVLDGQRVTRTHRVLDLPGGTRHYCGSTCIERDLTDNKGMHRALVVLLAQEVGALRALKPKSREVVLKD